MSVALAVTNDRAMAEEVTFDVYLSAWQHAANYNPDSRQSVHWLTRLARKPGHRPPAAGGRAPRRSQCGLQRCRAHRLHCAAT